MPSRRSRAWPTWAAITWSSWPRSGRPTAIRAGGSSPSAISCSRRTCRRRCRPGGPDRGLGHRRAGCDGYRPGRSPSTMREILAAGLERARARLEYTTLATAFLPTLFTLSDLQSVYETVWGTDLDLSNLRRKVLGASGFVAPTGLAATRGAGERGRPAELYEAGPGAILNPPITRPRERGTARASSPSHGGSGDHAPDVVVVGAGIAGLTAALTAADRGARVLLLVKGRISEAASSSWFAQGGVAAVQGADDDLALHIEDTLVAGRGLCRLSAVETLVHEIPERVAELRDVGRAVRRRPGPGGWPLSPAHRPRGGRRDRTGHHPGAGRPGPRRPRITIAETERPLRVVPGSHLVTDRRVISAPSIILATGGYAALWSRTSNPVGSIGEGLVIAWQAGCPAGGPGVRPVPPDRAGPLRAAAVRGAPGRWRDAHRARWLPLHRRAGAPGRRRSGGGGASRCAPGPAAHRPAQVHGPHGPADPGGLPARQQPHPGPARRPFLGRWHRHRPATGRPASTGCTRPANAPTPACMAPTGWPRTRSRSASCSGAAPPSPRSRHCQRPAAAGGQPTTSPRPRRVSTTGR